MPSPIKALTMRDEVENIETYIRFSSVLARAKKLKDGKSNEQENQVWTYT